MTDLDVAYVPTPKGLVRQMLLLSRLRRGEILFDLGAGDGRIIIEAARSFGAHCFGVEIDPERITRLKDRLSATRVKAEVIEGDLMKVDLSQADVVTIYLSDSVNSKLAPKLARELKSGSRVVSLDYTLPEWRQAKELTVKNSGLDRRIYLYIANQPHNSQVQ